MSRTVGSNCDPLDLTPEEAKHLTRMANKLDPLWHARKPYEKDPDEFVRLHRTFGCREWRKGVGNIGAQTPWVESPVVVLEKHGEIR